MQYIKHKDMVQRLEKFHLIFDLKKNFIMIIADTKDHVREVIEIGKVNNYR